MKKGDEDPSDLNTLVFKLITACKVKKGAMKREKGKARGSVADLAMDPDRNFENSTGPYRTPTAFVSLPRLIVCWWSRGASDFGHDVLGSEGRPG